MENKILRIKKAPEGYIYVHRNAPIFGKIIADTTEFPTYISQFNLVRHYSAEEQKEFLKLLEDKEKK